MNRKRWTPKEVVTEADWLFKEKRKWQLALRRYVLESKPSQFYAPYFGLDVLGFRKWIEIQFTEDLHWENFAQKWQFDHIVPVAYFDLAQEEDLKLCWNFINIRVEKLELNKSRGNRIDVMAVKPYFEDLFKKTEYSFCQKMLEKLKAIEVTNIEGHTAIENFIIENKQHLDRVATLNEEEFAQLNAGVSIDDILLQREILRKFGGQST